jgi:hypothetical protein
MLLASSGRRAGRGPRGDSGCCPRSRGEFSLESLASSPFWSRFFLLVVCLGFRLIASLPCLVFWPGFFSCGCLCCSTSCGCTSCSVSVGLCCPFDSLVVSSMVSIGCLCVRPRRILSNLPLIRRCTLLRRCFLLLRSLICLLLIHRCYVVHFELICPILLSGCLRSLIVLDVSDYLRCSVGRYSSLGFKANRCRFRGVVVGKRRGSYLSVGRWGSGLLMRGCCPVLCRGRKASSRGGES